MTFQESGVASLRRDELRRYRTWDCAEVVSFPLIFVFVLAVRNATRNQNHQRRHCTSNQASGRAARVFVAVNVLHCFSLFLQIPRGTQTNNSPLRPSA